MNRKGWCERLKIRNQIEYKVTARYALFSDPINRMGGEKLSYPVPTYQALKGVTESVYWKPSLVWIIDAVRVMKPIRTESKNIRPISYELPKNTLSVYTYLADVEYHVKAHFIWNENRPELAQDRNENKHHNIARRMIEKGGRRDVFLGTRECAAYVEPCEFESGEGFYDNSGTLDFGVMFHGFDYPDETGREMLAARLWQPRMVNGVIDFIPPWECSAEMKRDIRPMKAKRFGTGQGNFSGLQENSLKELNEGGEECGLDAETV